MREGDLVAAYRQMTMEGENFRGLSLLMHSRSVQGMIRRSGAVTLLDYGSGVGVAYEEPHLLHARWKVPKPRLYDPAIPEFSERPDEIFDGIICSDVMEHVPEHELEDAIVYMMTHSRLFLWASICCRPAKKFFPDGVTNLHVTIHPIEWWHSLFRVYAAKTSYRGVLSLEETA